MFTRLINLNTERIDEERSRSGIPIIATNSKHRQKAVEAQKLQV